ncbi:MAG TPA: hypothetical protein VL485_33340 [Ktedonobacteraceae bacterium]|jgi:hypothetical protein|nr:hypothetical protein [Ktedonobacteraceae bacterium]
MFFLILLWTLIGLCIGLLALPARLHPRLRYRGLILPLLGIVIAIPAGLLGLWLLGKDVATAMVLWLPIVGVLGLPRLFTLKWFSLQQKTEAIS